MSGNFPIILNITTRLELLSVLMRTCIFVSTINQENYVSEMFGYLLTKLWHSLLLKQRKYH